MITPQAERIFWQLVKAKGRELHNVLVSDLRNALDGIQQQGQRRSGRVPLVLGRIAAQNLAEQVTAAWNMLLRVQSDVGMEPDVATGAFLKNLMSQYINQVDAAVTELVVKMQPPSLGTPSEISRETASQRDRIDAEIDLLLEKLRQQRVAATAGSPAVFNFHGPVGAVQTGSGAVANVEQRIDGSNLIAVTSALQELENALDRAADVDERMRNDLRVVVKDTLAEVRLEQPNRPRLAGYAYALATSIQTAASLAPTYKLLKTAFSGIGIQLPW